MRNSEIQKELAVLAAKGDLLRKLTATRNIDAFLKVIDEEAATLTRETHDLNKRMQVITPEPRLTYPVTCKEVPTAGEEKAPLDFTLGNPYQMSVVGFLLFSVTDDKGRHMTFNTKQMEAFFENNG